MRIAFLTCALCLCCGSAFAQSVKGRVVDVNGEALIGVSVLEKGTYNGVMTDVDGSFEIRVAAGRDLEISCIGYVTRTVKAAPGLNIVLEEDSQMLEETVVIGYGVQKKSDVTGAVARVGSEDLTTKPVNNAFEALQGRAAGVDITSSQRPGTLGSVRVRGSRSISANNAPLYVVDGVPLSAGGIESINPQDIESIDILKDASSTAIYGSRGANGVIILSTKRGKEGVLNLNYAGSVTLEKIKDLQPSMSASDYITWRRWAYYNSDTSKYPRGDKPSREFDEIYFTASGDEAAYNNVMRGWSGGSWDPSAVVDTDWTDIVTRTGVSQQHSISASGGTKNVHGFASAGYLKNEGTQKGQSYERFNFASTVDVSAKPWFKAGASFNASYSVQEYGFSRTGQSSNTGPSDLYSAAKAIPRFAVPYDKDGDIVVNPGGSILNVATVIDEWNKSRDSRENYRMLGSFYAQLDFGKIWKPLEGLSWKTNFGPDFRFNRNAYFLSAESATRKNAGSPNTAKYTTDRYFSWTLDNMLIYDKSVGDHHFNLTLVQSASKYSKESASMGANAIPDDNYLWYNMGSITIKDYDTYAPSMSTSLLETQLASYLGRFNWSFRDRYLLTVSGRYDGSSVLAPGHKWAFFPSAALGWRIDKEDFMGAVPEIDLLKLRLGIGVSGNAAVAAYSSLGSIRGFYVPFSNGSAVQAYATNEPYYTSTMIPLANKELGWEKTAQYNLGLDFSFLRGRINGTLDLYTSRTSDLILDMSIPTLTGYSSTKANIGKTSNRGVELSLDAVPVQSGDFFWQTNLTFAWQKDRIDELSNGKNDDVSNGWFIGKSISVHYGIANAGIWTDSAEDKAEMEKFNANGHKFEPGLTRPVDQNGDYKIDDADRVILGNKDPRVTTGWYNTFNWKGLELGIEIFGRMGYMISTGGEGQNGRDNQRQIDYWTPDHQNAQWNKPVATGTAGSYGDAYYSLLGFKKASFLRIRNVSLGYSFQRDVCNMLGIKSLKVYAQARNLGNIFSSVDFYDLDLGATYYNRGVTFGVNIGF